MAKHLRRAITRLAAWGAVFALLFCAGPAAAARFTTEWNYDSRMEADSTRKDYSEFEYREPDYKPVAKAKIYDKTFVSSLNDLHFTLKGDLSDRQFLDVKETCHYQGYHPEDYGAYSLDAYKYSTLDHLLNVTYGVAVGESDALQLEYRNNVYRVPIQNIWSYISNRGEIRYTHRAGEHTGLSMGGSYEEREYADDRAENYQEGVFSIDLSTFLPERVRYTPVGSSMRGDRNTFEKMPTGMSTQKAVDLYTDWTRRPDVPDPQAKFLSRVTRGGLYLSLTGDLKTQRRTTIDNGYYQPSGTFRATYEADAQTEITLENTYYSRKHDEESSAYALYDHSSNKLSLSGRYQPSAQFVHLLTIYDESYLHSVHDEQDYRVDACLWDNYFTNGRTLASLNLRAFRTRHGMPRLFYADSDQYQMLLGYDYPFTSTWLLHLKDEWTDTDYKQFEDLVCSSFTRHTWRVGVEKQLGTQGLELAYQGRRERHSEFVANDVTEKSLLFSWLSHF